MFILQGIQVKKSTKSHCEFSIRSAYTGASWDNNTYKWRSQFAHGNVKVYLGMYKDDRIAGILHSLCVYLYQTEQRKTNKIFEVKRDPLNRLFAGKVGPIPEQILNIIRDITERKINAISNLTPELISQLTLLIPDSIPCTLITEAQIVELKNHHKSQKHSLKTSLIENFDFDKNLDELFSNEENNLFFGRPESPNDSSTTASSITDTVINSCVTEDVKKLRLQS